ncbi:MAG: OST-HTH/LOTUS domain-containing protein, partial [Oscillospiraceae bacterium]
IEVIRDRIKKDETRGQPKPAAKAEKKTTTKVAGEKSADKNNSKKIPDSIVELIADSVADLADDDGFSDMSNLGNLIIKKQPDFDPRNFGFGKLSGLLKAISRFEVEVRPTSDPHVKPMYIKDKEA